MSFEWCMSSWQWMCCVSEDIKRLAGKEFYYEHGQKVMNILRRNCSENFEIVSYPEDEEILAVIKEVSENGH